MPKNVKECQETCQEEETRTHRDWPTERPAPPLGARASRLQSRRFHRLWPCRRRRRRACCARAAAMPAVGSMAEGGR